MKQENRTILFLFLALALAAVVAGISLGTQAKDEDWNLEGSTSKDCPRAVSRAKAPISEIVKTTKTQHTVQEDGPRVSRFTRPFGKAITIRGLVTDVKRQIPIANALVRLYFRGSQDCHLFIQEVKTNQDGRFSIETLKLEKLNRLSIEDGVFVALSDAAGFTPELEEERFCESDGAVEFANEMERGGAIRGRCVTPDGKPVTQGTFTLYEFSAEEGYEQLDWGEILGDGTFVSSLASPTRILLAFECPQGYGEVKDVQASTQEVIDLGDIIIREEGTISGRVTFPSGNPVPGVRLGAYANDSVDEEGEESEDADTTQEFDPRHVFTTTDANGYFRLTGLKVGMKYIVEFEGQKAPDENVYLAPSNDLLLIHAGRHLAVQVVDQDRVPILGANIDLAELSKDKSGQPQLKYIESEAEDMARETDWSYFSIDHSGPLVVASWISTGKDIQRIEETINSVQLGLTKVRLVAASQDDDRKMVLDVWHPRNGLTKRFMASLASLKTGEIVQNLLCNDSGIAYLTALPDSYELRLSSVDYDKDTKQGLMLVEHREIIKIPVTGEVKHTVHLQEGGRINLTLSGDLRLLLDQVEPVFTRDGGKEKYLFRFGATRGCYTQYSTTLTLGKNTGEENILPGRYTLEINSKHFHPVRQSFMIEKNKVTNVSVELRLVRKEQ